jgi:hypothetical protein
LKELPATIATTMIVTIRRAMTALLETTLPDRSSNATELFATVLHQLEDDRTEVV